MKKTFALLLALLLVTALASASAQTAVIGGADGPTSIFLAGSGATTLTVQGTASVKLQPDYAWMSLGVTTRSEQVAEAQAQNAQLMTAVLDALAAAGVAEKDIATSGYSVSPIYEYEYGKLADTQVMKGYEVSNTLSVTVRALDSVGDVLDAAIRAGATQSYGLSYQSTQSAAAYDEALQKAVADAQRKAGLLAAAAGRELGELQSLTETPDAYTAYANTREAVAFGSAADTGAALMPGETTVSATVQAVYTLN